jgi:hypothetical protein
MELFFVICGLLIMGEASGFLLVVFMIKNGRGKWNTFKNRIYLGVDFLTGGVVASNYFLFESNWYAFFVAIAIIIAVVAHFNRTSEYLLKARYPFCTNQFFFALNNLKLVLLFGALFIVLPF